ncbi:Hypothetical predicted protein [Podarcis lilfordi]|uniref:Uncharacterized protein n=1 Tax=Podarcis lilfordi TaxID=74358 RepID=A0AA35JT35_9SAUR|nr:Hypothetical predicted protein [Podarcis lilfordi]
MILVTWFMPNEPISKPFVAHTGHFTFKRTSVQFVLVASRLSFCSQKKQRLSRGSCWAEGPAIGQAEAESQCCPVQSEQNFSICYLLVEKKKIPQHCQYSPADTRRTRNQLKSAVPGAKASKLENNNI